MLDKDMPDNPLRRRGQPALEGLRVLELGTFISAPFAATLLADFGAEVIKIELPQLGDPMRTLGAHPEGADSSFWWSSIARNKKSVALDVRQPEGREVLGRLVASADVLIENFRPGTLDRWGIDSEWLWSKRAGLVIARISGYGQDGPWRDVPGFDRNAQAFSGLVYVTGESHSPPQQAGLPVCDFSAGLWTAFGIVTALLARVRHGDPEGNEIDMALYESVVPFLKDMPQRWRHLQRVTERTGNTPDYVAPGGSYQAGDGEWVFISGTGDRVFERLMRAIDRDDLATDPALARNEDRVRLRPRIDAAIQAWLELRNADVAAKELQRLDVPAVKIQSISDLMEHPQVKARGNFIDVPDARLGEVCVIAPIPRLAAHGAAVRWSGQRLGESTEPVLRHDLGYTEQEIEHLRQIGVVGL
jgi:crotonobetainyl-CoA:carnitine CoA-transferase CaiB-like acyl-CoA transferase